MTRNTDPWAAAPPPAGDPARSPPAAAAADDPERVLGPATVAFRALYGAVCDGDGSAASAASLVIQDLCLQLCAGPVTSARAADDKARFLKIVIGWAWPRVPAVAAVLAASREWELRRWGQAVEGNG